MGFDAETLLFDWWVSPEFATMIDLLKADSVEPFIGRDKLVTKSHGNGNFTINFSGFICPHETKSSMTLDDNLRLFRERCRRRHLRLRTAIRNEQRVVFLRSQVSPSDQEVSRFKQVLKEIGSTGDHLLVLLFLGTKNDPMITYRNHVARLNLRQCLKDNDTEDIQMVWDHRDRFDWTKIGEALKNLAAQKSAKQEPTH
jgi:hypothetical protein